MMEKNLLIFFSVSKGSVGILAIQFQTCRENQSKILKRNTSSLPSGHELGVQPATSPEIAYGKHIWARGHSSV